MAVTTITLTSAFYVAYGEYDSVVSVLSSVGDVASGIVILFKVQIVFDHGHELLAIRTALQHSFSAVESAIAAEEARDANIRCLNKARSFCKWVFALYAAPCCSGFGLNIANMLMRREDRQLLIKAPAMVTQSDVWYWLLVLCSSILFGSFVFINGGLDMIFLSLCMHIRCKCEILRKFFRHANQRGAGRAADGPIDYWADDGSDFVLQPVTRPEDEIVAVTRACAQYHQQIVSLRDTTENVFSKMSLVVMSYLLLGLGIPGLRVLYDKSMDVTGVLFLMLYTMWNCCQLLFYCWFADSVAHASVADPLRNTPWFKIVAVRGSVGGRLRHHAAGHDVQDAERTEPPRGRRLEHGDPASATALAPHGGPTGQADPGAVPRHHTPVTVDVLIFTQPAMNNEQLSIVLGLSKGLAALEDFKGISSVRMTTKGLHLQLQQKFCPKIKQCLFGVRVSCGCPWAGLNMANLEFLVHCK
ncbi:uncharacterized protein LOC117646316 [Thrips palmi]|uniref:Odorant receptor n=1 Tax=Thrips palmi TaxID=161013 RepID=A0A6P8YSN9_THRPL|nr:uncharacterized protein LOC117646316 [Thrips palmi]